MDNIDPVILSLLNLSQKDIDSISSSGQNFIVTLKSDVKECIYCHSKDIESKGYCTRNIHLNNSLDQYDVKLKIKRIRCLNCRHSFSVSSRLAPPKSTISYSVVFTLMNLLLDTSITFQEAARLTGISVTSAVRIFDSHVHIVRKKLPEVICVDEVYTKNTDVKDGKFSFIIYDFMNHSIVDVVETRKKYPLYSYFEKIPESERDNVKYISMDMYFTYKQVAKKYFKKALICVDHFHIIKHLNEDLSRIRTRIMKKYSTDSTEYYLLKRFDFLLLDRTVDLDKPGKYNRKLGKIVSYRDILNLMLAIDNDLYQGYQLKERYMSFDRNMEEKDKAGVLTTLTNDFKAADIAEFREFVTILTNWKQEILNSFTLIDGVRINSSVAESLNARISNLIYNSRGIRNHERRRKRIMYAINKDGFLLK